MKMLNNRTKYEVLIKQYLSLILDISESKFFPPPTFNVDKQVIFSLFVGKNAIFSNID